MRKLLLLFTCISLNLIVNAQKIGEWVTHTPGMQVISVDVMHSNIFAATPYDIFYYNTNDNSINHLSKVNGLSDMGISLIRYSKPYDILFVGYTNTNIDIIDNQENIKNIPDIYNKYILGNKTINNVFFKDRYAYVCCGFGIVVIDLKRKEVKDTYIIGDNGNYLGVNDLTICNDIFYAATENGIYYADANNNHLADFSQWHRFKNHLPHETENFSQIEYFDDHVVANYYDKLANINVLFEISDTTSWGYFLTDTLKHVSDMRVCDNNIIVTEETRQIRVYDTDKNLVFSTTNIEPYSATYDKSRNCYWAGTRTKSLVRINPSGKTETIKFNGPYSDKTFSINASGNDVWIAAGGYTSTWAPTWNHDGFSYYNGDRWYYKNMTNASVFDSIADITCVKSDPTDNNIVYASSFSKGLIVFEGGKATKVYGKHNSSLGYHLQWQQLGEYYVFLTGFDFDSDNNMWIANTGAEKMLSVRKTDGTWQAFNIGNNDIGRIMVDKNDIKWIYKRGGEIIVFNDNIVKTINETATTGNLPGDANCFVTDNDGTVWVGTTDGLALFKDSNSIFNSNTYECSRILIPRNDGTGQADYLLSGQTVLAIAVDGANNMWFGTTNGVIQTSNDGQTTYHHFTMENSPLFSNTVTDIAIDDDGNIYFVTDKGIISYKGTATKGFEKNTNVLVYPNPVKPEHQGIVGIKGLVTDALVKITTTNGSFVTHLQAQGGQAVWDCTDINGNKVQPGIYLIFVSDETGKETYATKVLIMK